MDSIEFSKYLASRKDKKMFEDYLKFYEDNVNGLNVDLFIMSMFLQQQGFKVPEITPTNFGMSVHKRIIDDIIFEKIKLDV